MKKTLLFLLVLLVWPTWSKSNDSPNILWIYVDDMSDWLGCYGYEKAETPNVDQLAREGVRFERAFIPAPVCSATRSALITGTMQTSFGLHHHRTMIKKPLPDSLKTVPELFREAGYITFNEEKEDYNFLRDRDLLYSPEFKRPGVRGHIKAEHLTCLEQLKGKKFFGQLQLKGGKYEGETGGKYPMPSRIAAEDVDVPPYYPDTPVFRNAIARHYEQIAHMDDQVGAIVEALKRYDLWDTTAIFFFSDHGAPLPRAKQFLYEDGVKVPLIVRWPKKLGKGTVRDDLVSGIDIPATSLALANLPIPDYMEGQDVFADNYTARDFVISARDRCGIAVDRIRSVRTDQFRYIKNFQTDRALYQPQYRDGYATFKDMRARREAGELTPLQAAYLDHLKRPEDELYHLESDPHQIHNLAADPAYGEELKRHRGILEQWIEETDDKGQYPESRENLKAVFKQAKGKVASPEYDFLK